MLEDRIGEALNLSLEGESVLAKKAAILTIFEAFDVGPLKPRQRRLRVHAPVRAMDAEAFLKISVARADQLQVTERGVFEGHVDAPAVHGSVRVMTRADGVDGTDQEPSGVHQVRA